MKNNQKQKTNLGRGKIVGQGNVVMTFVNGLLSSATYAVITVLIIY